MFFKINIKAMGYRVTTDDPRYVLDQHAELDFYSASSLKQDMSLHLDTLSRFQTN
jgi:hypothetical protein